jgi:hypothetical protein
LRRFLKGNELKRTKKARNQSDNFNLTPQNPLPLPHKLESASKRPLCERESCHEFRDSFCYLKAFRRCATQIDIRASIEHLSNLLFLKSSEIALLFGLRRKIRFCQIK